MNWRSDLFASVPQRARRRSRSEAIPEAGEGKLGLAQASGGIVDGVLHFPLVTAPSGRPGRAICAAPTVARSNARRESGSAASPQHVCRAAATSIAGQRHRFVEFVAQVQLAKRHRHHADGGERRGQQYAKIPNSAPSTSWVLRRINGGSPPRAAAPAGSRNRPRRPGHQKKIAADKAVSGTGVKPIRTIGPSDERPM